MAYEKGGNNDMNDLITSGTYYYEISSNAPSTSGSRWWYVIVLGQRTGNDICQIAIENNDTKIFFRFRNAQAWLPNGWKQINVIV